MSWPLPPRRSFSFRFLAPPMEQGFLNMPLFTCFGYFVNALTLVKDDMSTLHYSGGISVSERVHAAGDQRRQIPCSHLSTETTAHHSHRRHRHHHHVVVGRDCVTSGRHVCARDSACWHGAVLWRDLAGRRDATLRVLDQHCLCLSLAQCLEWYRLTAGWSYSISVMVLQYFLPLTILALTYVHIAVVVWTKQVPGEAQNNRDQKLTASKRKVYVYRICITYTLYSSTLWDIKTHQFFITT